MKIDVKICGLTSKEAVHAATAAKADYAGFVYFPPSPRHLPLSHAAKLKALLPSSIQSVSVLVDPNDTLLKEVISILKPNFLQLHGKETSERVKEIRSMFPQVKIIKGIPIRSSDDVAAAMRFAECIDMLLFDAKAEDLPGGTGLSFDWNLLKNRQFPLPWLLAGGLNADNVAEAIRASGAHAVDVSSSVESAPGVKNPALIDAFVKAAKSA
jgi:phosphoribosylanthranilate isomerase